MAETKDPFAFLDKLDKDQRAYADEIIDKSEKMGIDPRLPLAMTYVESRFNPKAVSPKGAIGLMQVMPDTGEEMGYSKKDLYNTSKNIDAGLTYLQGNIAKLGDPVLAVAGYHAGRNHPYFTDPKKFSLPQDTMTYLESVRDLGGFTVTPPAEEQAAQPTTQSAEPTAEEPTPASEGDFRKQLAAMIGGVGGFGLGVKQAMKAPALPTGELVAPTGAQGAATTNAQTSGGRYAAKTGYGVGEGTVKEVVERHKKFEPRGLGEQMFAGDAKKSSMGAGPRNLQVVPGTIAPLSINAQVPQPPETPKVVIEPPKLNMAQRAGQATRDIGGVLGRFPMLTNALAGASGGAQAQEASTRLQSGDRTGAAIAGVGALGSLASMVPHPATRALGAGASMASPAALAVLDRLRAVSQQPKIAPSPEEMRNARNPAFMFPKP
jgi:hypothetical protein